MCFVHRQEGHPCIYLFYLALPRLAMNPLAPSPHLTPLIPPPLDFISAVPSLSPNLLSFAMNGTCG